MRCFELLTKFKIHLHLRLGLLSRLYLSTEGTVASVFFLFVRFNNSRAHHHTVDHNVGQRVSSLPPGPHSLWMVLQLGVPLFRSILVLGLKRIRRIRRTRRPISTTFTWPILLSPTHIPSQSVIWMSMLSLLGWKLKSRALTANAVSRKVYFQIYSKILILICRITIKNCLNKSAK